MAIYKLNSKKKKEKNPNVKKITGFSLIGAGSVIFLLLTGIIAPLQTFFLGLFGVFGYPLCIILCIVGLALVNNRRYVMPKRYLICLILCALFALCIIQLAIVGNKNELSFWQYLGKNYSDKWTAGGIIVGLFTTICLYIANIYGAYIIFVLAFVLCFALLLDSLKFFKKQRAESEPVSVQIKDNNLKPVEEKVKVKEPVEEVNVVLNGNLKADELKQQQALEQKPQPLTARQILGLDKKREKAYETTPAAEVVVPKEPEKPKSLKEYILTPPKIDIDEYFKDVKKQNEAPATDEVKANVQALKSEDIQPSQVYYEDEFKVDKTPIVRRPLPEVKSEELVEQADDILRSAIEEEKQENPEIFNEQNSNSESINNQSAEQNVINNLPSRDNSGSFGRRDFNGDRGLNRGLNDRPNFNRRGEILNQEDADARADFNRQQTSLNTRNGMLSREQQPIAPEEPATPKEPYIYEKPSFDLITTQSVDLSTHNEDVATKRVLLENTLETFGVPAKVQSVVVGPAVTRYELEMPVGISVQKIKNRADDIALSLAAEGSIRIEAPIPGKSMVGIEVPNASIATVSLKDVLNSKEFLDAPSPLTFAIGKDITGQTICCNMQKLTHLLVAGATNSGKSVCLNAIILSIIYKASPEDVKIVLIDPKRVEFSSYEALPHLIMPNVVCDTQKAINTLTWAVAEMERRFEVLGLARVKNIDEFNQTSDVLSGKIEKMPFIVIIVDELADLMMTGKKDVEEKICRLAQKARAAGIHLVLATQRPSVDVVTGLIKSNFPSRISFAVKSAVDSMTILDRVGAEKLLGRGDMLYFPNGAKDPLRVQGCFISTKEINSIVDYVRDNNMPIFDKEIEDSINNPNKNTNGGGANYNTEIDPLLPEALRACMDCKLASATMIRRRFAIGYPRAARIIDQMEAAGYISSADGVKGRTVYITEEEFKEYFGDV